MAIALPPPSAPQFEAIEAFVAHAPEQAFHLKQNDVDVWLYGFDETGSDALVTAIGNAANQQQIVVALATYFYLHGDLQDRLIYSKTDNMLFVQRQRRRIVGYDGPNGLRPYFDDLLKDGRLTLTGFEKARVLASQYSDRNGRDYAVGFEARNADDVVLTLRPQSAARQVPVAVQLGVDNYGSRYAGENATSADFTLHPGAGFAFNLGGRTSPDSLNASSGNGELFEIHGGTNRVTPLGFVGLSGRMLRFDLPDNATPVTGEFVEYAADWTGVGAVTVDSRMTMQLRVAFTDQQTLTATHSNTAKNGSSPALPGPGLPTPPDPGLPPAPDPTSPPDLPPAPDLPPPDPADPLQTFQTDPANAPASGQSANSGFQERFITAELSPGWSGGTQVPYALGLRLKYATATVQTLSAADERVTLVQPYLSLGGDRTAARLDASGQWSSGSVPEFLQWTLGGPATMSAYVSGTAAGDAGYHLRAGITPWRHRTAGIGARLQLFAETAAAQRNADALVTNLYDAGVRLGIQFGRTLVFEAVSALPFAEDPNAGLDNAHASWFATAKLSF